jgi:hypothetical protein
MKRTITLFSAMLAVYTVGYLFLRWQFHSSSSVFIPTETGYSGPVHREETCIWIPGTGAGRPVKQALYWIFYPAGWLDQIFTGRVYSGEDARNIIL